MQRSLDQRFYPFTTYGDITQLRDLLLTVTIKPNIYPVVTALTPITPEEYRERYGIGVDYSK